MPSKKGLEEDKLAGALFCLVATQEKEQNYAVALSAKVKNERAFVYRKLLALEEYGLLRAEKIALKYKTVFAVNWRGFLEKLIARRNQLLKIRQKILETAYPKDSMIHEHRRLDVKAFSNDSEAIVFVALFIQEYAKTYVLTTPHFYSVTIQHLFDTFLEVISGSTLVTKKAAASFPLLDFIGAMQIISSDYLTFKVYQKVYDAILRGEGLIK